MVSGIGRCVERWYVGCGSINGGCGVVQEDVELWYECCGSKQGAVVCWRYILWNGNVEAVAGLGRKLWCVVQGDLWRFCGGCGTFLRFRGG